MTNLQSVWCAIVATLVLWLIFRDTQSIVAGAITGSCVLLLKWTIESVFTAEHE